MIFGLPIVWQIPGASVGDGAISHGLSVEGPRDRDITYTNCVALNNYHDAGEGYWNAEGFCAERVENLRYVNCLAFDNTDGGWDRKAENVLTHER